MVDLRKTVQSLHYLILVNNDRVKWYEKAIEDIQELDLSLATLFEEFADESRLYSKELDEKIKLLGSEDGIDSTTIEGKFFRMWSDIRSAFTEITPEQILSSCEHVEDKVQEAYRVALQESKFMDEDSIQMLEQHQMVLRDMHDEIKAQRDENTID